VDRRRFYSRSGVWLGAEPTSPRGGGFGSDPPAGKPAPEGLYRGRMSPT
jgi:hypothetical protein